MGLRIHDDVLKQYKELCKLSAKKDEPIGYKIRRMVDLGEVLYSHEDCKTIRYYYINLLVKNNEVVRMWKDKNMPSVEIDEKKKDQHKKSYFNKEKSGSELIYNKVFKFERSGIQRRHVSVDEKYNVKTNLMPRQLLPLLAKELSESLSGKFEYKRINPYRFDTTTNRHVYIEYAELNQGNYELYKKMILRRTHSGNFKIPEGTFLYDVLDYLVHIGMLDNNYKFISELNENTLDAKVAPLVDKAYLESRGFKFPTNHLVS